MERNDREFAHQHDVHQGLVQGRSEVAEAVDALAVAERLRQGAAQRQRCPQGQRAAKSVPWLEA